MPFAVKNLFDIEGVVLDGPAVRIGGGRSTESFDDLCYSLRPIGE